MNPQDTIYIPDSIIRPVLPLAAIDGGLNTSAIIDIVTSALTNAGNSDDVILAYQTQAAAGDYPNLIAVTAAFIDVQ